MNKTAVLMANLLYFIIAAQNGGATDWKLEKVLGDLPDIVSVVKFSPDDKEIGALIGPVGIGNTSNWSGKFRTWAVEGWKIHPFWIEAEKNNLTSANIEIYFLSPNLTPDGRLRLQERGDEISVSNVKMVPKNKAGEETAGVISKINVKNLNASLFLPGGRRLLVSGSEGWQVWDIKTAKPVHYLPKKYFPYPPPNFMSPSGKFITLMQASPTTLFKEIALWDTVTGKLISTFKAEGFTFQCGIFSPDEKIFAAGGADKTVRLWNVESGTEIRVLQNGEQVASLCFSPDGKYLVVGGGNPDIPVTEHETTIKIWDLQNGRDVQTLQGHAGIITSLNFNSDGTLLASGGMDKCIKIWTRK